MSAYWEKRMEQLFIAQDKRDGKLNKRLEKEYQRLGAKIEKEIASYYAKFAVDDVIDYRRMVEKLDPLDRDLLYKDYESFSFKFPQYSHLMPVRESIYQLNRLEGLQLSMQMMTFELGAMEIEEFTQLLSEAYERGYLSTMKGLDNKTAFFGVNQAALEMTLNEQWVEGGNFSSRIWTNKEKLLNTLNNEIRDAMIRGESYRSMTSLIEHRLKVGTFNAKRLVATESAFIMNQANKQAFMNAGIKRYEITAVLDRKTSKTCRNLNGEKFEFDSAVVGVNYPPFHAFCRTTVVPIEN